MLPRLTGSAPPTRQGRPRPVQSHGSQQGLVPRPTDDGCTRAGCCCPGSWSQRAGNQGGSIAASSPASPAVQPPALRLPRGLAAPVASSAASGRALAGRSLFVSSLLSLSQPLQDSPDELVPRQLTSEAQATREPRQRRRGAAVEDAGGDGHGAPIASSNASSATASARRARAIPGAPPILCGDVRLPAQICCDATVKTCAETHDPLA